jgi:hypothetical protein
MVWLCVGGGGVPCSASKEGKKKVSKAHLVVDVSGRAAEEVERPVQVDGDEREEGRHVFGHANLSHVKCESECESE